MGTKSKESNQKTDWIFIPGGPAVIGADRPGEGPAQVLHVPGFCIGRIAITNQEFRSFIKDGGYDRAELWDADGWSWVTAGNIHEPAFWRESIFNLSNQPVTGVCFHEAQAYGRWVSARLPTEIEWEKAARGTNGALYPWGEHDPNASRANFAPGFVPIHISPIPVEECAPGDSPYGCRQMSGNVYEWCQDFFHADTPAKRSSANLFELRASRRRVMKGGSWGSGASRLRPAARWSSPPELRDNVIGFRLVRDECV